MDASSSLFSLIPSTGGVFTVDVTHALIPAPENREGALNEVDERWNTQMTRIWDRKAEGGFPETKTLKKLVRDIIDPSRDLGHADRQKAPPPPPSNFAVREESSWSGAVSVSDQKASQLTTTTRRLQQ
ncbi:hypothetical protein MMC29_000875 [Sticta canariensis]|nr:hypothetical protein [Sticta canariensis]